MSENKFIAQLKGNTAPGSVLEIQDKGSKTSFANMPSGTSDAIVTYSDKRNNATAVLKGAMNWKVNGSTLSVANPAGDGSDYTGQTDVAGISDQQGNNLWINASYAVPADGLFLTKNTKWVLKLCGDNLIVNGGDTAEFTVLITAGNYTNITKKFFVAEQANQFCKELVIDFAESNTSTVKLEQGDTITLKLLSDIPNASARIYQGMTTLTLLQRAVDAENVISKNGSYEDVWEEINKKVNIDGSSTMTGPLKMRASVSFQCAIAPYWDGVGFYKLNDDDSVTLLASIEATDGFLPYASNTYNIGSSAHKWKDLYLGGKAYVSTLNNGANISVPTTGGTLGLNDFSNITDSAKNIGNWSSNVTNCITEIPQDIKLELNNGTLTLKSGSVLYKGDGSFTKATLANDISISPTPSNGKRLVFTNGVAYLDTIDIDAWVSGSTEPTSGLLWFNTTDNKIYNGGPGNWAASSVCLPLGVVTVSGNQIVSIDQVFNGFGFMGSTIFMLPGVTLVKPNGRNTDGSLKNTISTTTSVRTNSQVRPSTNGYLIYAPSGQAIQKSAANTNWYYDERRNLVSSLGGDTSWMIWGSYTTDANDRIISFEPKFNFRVVDYNDSEYISNCAMPSSRYIDLTLGTSGATYTAPADGYIVLSKIASSAGQYIAISNGSVGKIRIYSSGSSQELQVTLPVAKGNVVALVYTADGNTQNFRFVYANGSK